MKTFLALASMIAVGSASGAEPIVGGQSNQATQTGTYSMTYGSTSDFGITQGAPSSWAACAERYALCLGLRSNMAVMHEDGSWTIDWPETERVAALSPEEQNKTFPGTGVVIGLARVLLSDRGHIVER